VMALGSDTYDKLIFNYLVEHKKKCVDEFERVSLLRQYMSVHDLSVRKVAEEIGVPHTTIQGWLSWEKMKPEEYDALRSKDVPKSTIIGALKKKGFNPKELVGKSMVVLALEECISRLRPFVGEDFNRENGEVKELCVKLRDMCSRILMKVDV